MSIPTEAETPISSETPTPAEGRGKRRGLALPPRGQALTRLQDLEADGVPPAPNDSPSEAAVTPNATASSNSVNDAVHTASSNAVTPQVHTVAGKGRDIAAPPETPTAAIPEPPASRPVREPTTRITVDMPDSLHRRISLLSVEERRSIKDLVIEALHRTYFQPGTATEEESR